MKKPLLILIGAVFGLLVFFGIGYQVFDGSLETMQNTTDYFAILGVNALIGISVALLIIELRWDALRVALTVVVALLLGYLVTFAFNFDAADRFAQGEFTVRLLSEAEAVEVEGEETDIAYGRQRGNTFDGELMEDAYVFRGSAGDVVSIVALAANRRSEVDMQVALLDEGGAVLAEATDIAAEKMDAYDDVRRETDALIEDFALPADGLYTIRAQPEVPGLGTVISEATAASNVAFEAFLLGPLSRPNRWAVWIQDALTLTLVGLAVAVVFRAEQFSLGAEGQLYFGALVSGIIALNMPNMSAWLVVPLAITGSLTAGFLWGLLPGALKAYLGANELVSTLMLNVIAVRFYELVLTYQLKPPDAGYIASADFPDGGKLLPLLDGTQVTIAVFFLLAVVVLAWLLIRRTPLGYEIRMIGSNIRFADYGGVRTARNIMLVMAISGAIAGLAGAHLAMGIHRRLIVNISFGLAFEGVVVALLARNNVLVTPFTGLLYAYLRTGAQFMERDANVSFEVVRIIQAVIILLITAEALVSFFRQRQILRRGTKTLDPDASDEALPGTTEEAARV